MSQLFASEKHVTGQLWYFITTNYYMPHINQSTVIQTIGLMINLFGQNLDYEYTLLEGTFFPFVNNKSHANTVMVMRGTKRPFIRRK